MSAPYFTMFWSESIPQRLVRDASGRNTKIVLIAGALSPEDSPLAPPPDSWAARTEADLAIWTIRMDPEAHWTLPAARGSGTKRNLYFFKGRSATIAGQTVRAPAAIELPSGLTPDLINGNEDSEFLLLQGRPIGEPVAQYGPFVMNTQAEIAQTFAEYRRTGFGGWPWPDDAPVHGREASRFARHPDGREEKPTVRS
jgi:redox-sensitive bicupin YhaK (pirin superfamily)